MKKQVVFIDSNCTNDDGSYYIEELIVKSKKLKKGDAVIAYQDNEEWDAEISFSNNKWGAILKSEARLISQERYEGHKEGYWEGCYNQRHILLILLENLQAPETLILEIKQWMGIV